MIAHFSDSDVCFSSSEEARLEMNTKLVFEGDLQTMSKGRKKYWIYFQLRWNLILHIKRIPFAFHFVITFD
jgi:hypothetical protein